MRMLLRPALCAALLFTAACPLSPGERERRLGTIEFYGDPVRIDVPATAVAGQPFQVSVTTYGGGCVTQGDTEASVRGNVADVTPYDWGYVGEAVCTMELRMHGHTATLRFDAPGEARVRVHGMREAPSGNERITVTRTVTVTAAGTS